MACCFPIWVFYPDGKAGGICLTLMLIFDHPSYQFDRTLPKIDRVVKLCIDKMMIKDENDGNLNMLSLVIYLILDDLTIAVTHCEYIEDSLHR